MPLTYRCDGALRKTPRHDGLNATTVRLGADHHQEARDGPPYGEDHRPGRLVGFLLPATETVWGPWAVVALLGGAVVEAPGARAA
jgi:hypothetical protein